MELFLGRYARLILSLMVVLLPNPAAGAKSSASPSPALSANRFIGVWKINVEKSSAGTKSMLVTVERKGGDYSLTLDSESDAGHKFYYSAITSMKGEIVKALDRDGKPKMTGYDANGQPVVQEWRITLESPDAFLIDWLGQLPKQERYELSSDGRTMTISDVPGKSGIIAGKIESSGRFAITKHIRVLDKVTQPR